MPNLIDKLVTKVDTIRQRAADRFGLPRFNLYRVLRTWDGGEVGAGNPTSQVDLITPTPRIELSGKDVLLAPGRDEGRTMKAYEISLTYTESFLKGDPKSAGQECYYRLVERNAQGAKTTTWILIAPPQAIRDEINWELGFGHYHTNE